MNWLALTLLAITSRAVFGVAVKLLSSNARVSASTQAILLTTGAGLLAILSSPLVGGLTSAGLLSVWYIALVMVLAQAFGNILFFKGLEKLDASTAQIAFASILLWSTILSIIFLHSSFTLKQFFGIGILLLAILSVQYGDGSKRRVNSGVIYVVTSTLLFAVFQISSAELAKTVSAGTYTVLAFLGSSIIVALVYTDKLKADFKSFIKPNAKRLFPYTLFACCTSLLYFVFSYFAYKHAPDRGLVVVLLTSQVILSVILAIIFLREKSYLKQKISGGVLAVIAGILIKS